MIVYSGGIDQLIVNWHDHMPLGKIARIHWDDIKSSSGSAGWSYTAYTKSLNKVLAQWGGNIELSSPGYIDIKFDNPADYTLFCLRMG